MLTRYLHSLLRRLPVDFWLMVLQYTILLLACGCIAMIAASWYARPIIVPELQRIERSLNPEQKGVGPLPMGAPTPRVGKMT